MVVTEQRIPMHRHFRVGSKDVRHLVESLQQMTLMKDEDFASEQTLEDEWPVVTRLQSTNKKPKGQRGV